MSHRLLILSIVIASLCACSKSPAPNTASTVPTASAVASTTMPRDATAILHDPQDPCGLLDPGVVETVLGEPLAVPPYRADNNRNPDPTGDYCTYRGKDLRSIKLDVSWKNGKKLMKMLSGISSDMNTMAKGTVKLPISGTTLDGDWDVASIANCCTFMALRDDTMVTINIGGSRATQEQAAKLADAAMKNIDKPLPIDGSASVDAATRLLQGRPQIADACALLNRADAEAALGPLTAAPVAKENDQCAYSFTNARGHADQMWIKLVTSDGFADFRQRNNIFETVDQESAKSSAGMDDRNRALLSGLTSMNSHHPEPAGPWDDATSSTLEFDLVKHDIFVTIAGAPDHDSMRALAEKVAAKL